jgi:hypothetical protein
VSLTVALEDKPIRFAAIYHFVSLLFWDAAIARTVMVLHLPADLAETGMYSNGLVRGWWESADAPGC